MARRSISKATIRKLVNQAETEFAWCFNALIDLKQGDPTNDLLEVQPRLAEALHTLSEAYQRIAARRSDLIKRKEEVSGQWFRRRQRQMAGLQAVLIKAIEIGRSIGDAFVWFWYQHEPTLLREHLRMPSDPLFSTGVGGIGEVGAAQKVQVFNSQLVLHHSITSMLRIGDVSLVDFDSRGVAALGEIKAEHISDNRYHIHLELLGDQRLVDALPASSGDATAPSRPSWSPSQQIRSRLERQLKRMDDTLTVRRKESPGLVVGRSMEMGFDALASVLAQISWSCRGSAGLVFPGLIAVALSPSHGSLFTRLSWKGNTADFLPSDFDKAVGQLRVDGSPYNALWLGAVQYRDDGGVDSLPGGLHPFWWPVESSLLEALLLRRVEVLTAYNPAHVLHRFEAEGFVIEGEPPWREVALLWEGPDGTIRLGGLAALVDLIPRRFVSEEEIVRLLKEFVEHACELPPELRARRLELRVNQVLGPSSDEQEVVGPDDWPDLSGAFKSEEGGTHKVRMSDEDVS